MLVLSRKIGEEIVIGGNIRIRVIETRRGNVRLGISAPEDVIVDRQEVSKKRLNAIAKRAECVPISLGTLGWHRQAEFLETVVV